MKLAVRKLHLASRKFHKNFPDLRPIYKKKVPVPYIVLSARTCTWIWQLKIKMHMYIFGAFDATGTCRQVRLFLHWLQLWRCRLRP